MNNFPAEEVVWSPLPRQKSFMRRKEFEALYGGAAGGGKSDALVIEALRQVGIPHYKCIIIRKTFPQLRELIDKSLSYYPRIVSGCRYNAGNHVWTFPSGARIIFGSMNRPQDRIQYQGQAYDAIFFDELTHFTWDEYSYLFSRCRPNGPGTECYIRSTANPGNIGHGWVKERFITAGTPGKTIWEDVRWTDPDGKVRTARRSRIFIPSTVFDNDILLKNDPLYVANLAALPEAERKALLYGDWDSFSGQCFREWKNDPDHYRDRVGTHVIDPFLIPADWSVYCGLDWGYARPFAVVWFAVDHDRRLYLIREYYGCTGTPNVGIQKEPAEVARQIRETEAEDRNLRGRQIIRVGDPAIWGSQTGESIGSIFEKERIFFEKGDNHRLDGKMQLHHRLSLDDSGIPMLYVFSTAVNFIRTVPNLVYDQTRVEDVDSAGEDHIYDATRYVLMMNPIAAPVRAGRPQADINDPFDRDLDQSKWGRYDFYLK